MKETNNKIRIAILVAKVLLVIGLVAALVYGCMQIKGLKNRMTTAENRLNDGGISSDVSESADEATVDYTIISQEDGIKEVEDYDPSLVKEGDSGVSYKEKKVTIFEVSVSNPTKYPVEISTLNFRAKTDKGQLISPTITKDQSQYSGTIPTGLAPGGKTTLTLVYLPIEGEKIVGLYDDLYSRDI